MPQPWQLFGSLVVSTQEPAHRSGAVDGQPETHAYEPPEPAHTAVPPSPLQALPQLPQLAAVVYWTHAPLQSLYPLAHANVHPPWTHTGCAWSTVVVHAAPHTLQLFSSLVVSTHASPQRVGVADGQLATQA